MREINDIDTSKLNINVNGEFTLEEANDLKKLILERIIGRNADYETILKYYCKDKGYTLEINEYDIIINK